MSIIKRTLVLTGGRAGQTVLLGKMYQFTDGKIVLNGSSHNVEALTRWMSVNYAAYPEGSSELEAANGERNIPENEEQDPVDAVLDGSEPAGEGTPPEEAADGPEADGIVEGTSDGPVPEGNGHEHSRVDRIKEALSHLDVTKPDHWTAAGLPAVSAVEFFLDDKISRAELNAVAPDFNREG